MVNREVPKKSTFWVPALVVKGWVLPALVMMGWVIDFLGTCFGGAGLGLNSWAIYGDEGSALRDFLGTCFGGEGLGLNSWDKVDFWGTCFGAAGLGLHS